MKVADFFKDFWPPVAAGITRYLADIAATFIRPRWQVDVHVAGVRRSRRDVLPSGVVVHRHRHRELGRMLSSPLAAETMSTGLPAVSTALGTATDWLNQDGTSGLVVSPGNAEGLGAALERLRTAAERRRLGAGARVRAQDLFSFDRHADGLLDIYQQVL